jgi:outer membrane protein TolC
MGPCRRNIIRFSALVFLLSSISLSAQPKSGAEKKGAKGGSSQASQYFEIPLDKSGKPRPLSLDETIRLVLKNNSLVRIQQMEIIKSDTELLKEESKYAPILGMGYQGYEKVDKETPSSLFTGTRTNQDRVYANISKLFSSGTYFKLEVSDTRFDNNAGESAAAQSSLFSRLAQPPLHTGALTLMLRQELVKNSFGYTQRRINDIANNNAQIRRLETVLQLSQLVVKTMIDYWQLAIAEENIGTLKVMRDNTVNIRNITMAKQRIGLAESFEIHQWNALVSGADIRLSSATLERNLARATLLRVLNLDPSLPLTGSTELYETIPSDINMDADIEISLRERPEYVNMRLRKLNAIKLRELAKNSLLPSVTISGSVSSRDQGRKPDTAFNAVPEGTYPESSVEFRVEYPFGDDGAEADMRNADLTLQQVNIQENEMRRQVEDEVRDGYDRIQIGFQNMKESEKSLKETEAFFDGLIYRYRQGRFTAEAVKNALDALVQARQVYMQSRINFNISLIRYDLVRNQTFKRFNINIDSVIDELK